LDLLKQHGFTHFRGAARVWYERREPPRALDRLARLWAVLVATTPPVAFPKVAGPGITDVPASMMYLPSHGVRRAIPVSRRVSRALRGLDAAARRGGVFHLWFHPTNLADRTEAMVEGLSRILARVSELRAAGSLRVEPMGNLAG
jgi:hypothetical protein